MKSGYRLRSHTVAMPAPPSAPPSYVLWKERNGTWHVDGPHPVAAILIGCEELSAPARLRASQRRTPSGKEITHREVDFEDEFAERHFEGAHWRYVPIAFVLLPAHCAEWESIIVPQAEIAFSEEAAKAIAERRNSERGRNHG
ncbi:MAG: hypothetical protein HUU26_00540 [Gemmatimonadaceae bacterium]|nr:hypothetical protein [Gemmatimonadaceae bacterium]